MSTGHPRRPTRGVVRPCVGGLRQPVVPAKSESGGALPQPAPVHVPTGESDRAMHAQLALYMSTTLFRVVVRRVGTRLGLHRVCLKVSGYEVIDRARGSLGANFCAIRFKAMHPGPRGRLSDSFLYSAPLVFYHSNLNCFVEGLAVINSHCII